MLASKNCSLLASHQRMGSPCRWQQRQPTYCRNVKCMSSVQPTTQDETTDSDKDRDSDSKSYSRRFLARLNRNLMKISKVKESIDSIWNSVPAVNLELPSSVIPDYRKYVQLGGRLINKTDKLTENLKDAMQERKKNSKKSQIQSKMEAKGKKQDEISFKDAMLETNDSITSFYTASQKLLVITENDMNSNALALDEFSSVVSPSVKKEEESMLSIFVKAYSKKFTTVGEEKRPVIRKDFVSRASIDSRTKSLVIGLRAATSGMSKLSRTQDLCNHLMQFPESRAVAVKEKVIPCLLKQRQSSDKLLKAEANEALALVGYVNPVKGRGIRMLSCDGGGTRGLVAIEALRQLEAACKMDITQMFDYVCGVSTGGLIMAMVFLLHIPLDECEIRYKDFSRQMFTRNKLIGTGKLVWNHAFYDTEVWEEILRQNVGDRQMAEFSRDGNSPKMSAISSVINVGKLKNFIFRTYNHPPNVQSNNPGNCKQKVWEVIRASSAAPGYYEEFTLGNLVHQDGGLLSNNPTALGIHECRLLWPNESLQCVVSLGNGRYEPALEYTTSKPTLKDKISRIVDSATDTEAVHVTLQDLLAPSTYYRFNPYVSEEFTLDEIRPEKLDILQQDAQMYLRKNKFKVSKAAEQLTLKRRPHQKLRDFVKLKADSF